MVRIYVNNRYTINRTISSRVNGFDLGF